MKRILIAMAVFVLLGAGVIAITSNQPAPAKSAAMPEPITTKGVVIAEGKVVPVQRAALSFKMGGVVSRTAVAVGDRVETGQLLARLETHELELQLAQTEANLGATQAKLAQLRRGAVAAERAAAQQNLDYAQAAYDDLLLPNDQELVALKSDYDKAQAQVEQAQAAYDRIGGDAHPYAAMTTERAQLQAAWIDQQRAHAVYKLKLEPTSAQIQQALAAIQNAKSQLAKLDATEEELAVVAANVRAAQAARDLAAEQLKNAQILAPMAGVVTANDLRIGEYVQPGTPVLRVADVSAWEIETTDLAESGVAQIALGSPAKVTFDAIPGLELAGRVTRIKLFGENRQGDIVYTVTVTPDQGSERLRWNMTTTVKIDKEE